MTWKSTALDRSLGLYVIYPKYKIRGAKLYYERQVKGPDSLFGKSSWSSTELKAKSLSFSAFSIGVSSSINS